MSEIVFLQESGGAPAKRGKRWLVTVARPGTGATGEYPEDVLREYGPAAIPAGTKAFFKHAKPEDRDVRDMVGTYKDGAFWNEEDGELQAYLTPYPRYAPVLEEAGSDIEASIRVAARKDARGVVRELVYNRANTVDLVAFGGLEGSGLKFQVESLFSAAAEENGKEKNMTDINKEEFDAFVARVDAFAAKFDTFVAESKLEVTGKADADAVEAAVVTRVEEALSSYAEVEKSIDDADILTVQKESLKARARKGEDVTFDLAEAVSFVVEARKELAPDATRPASVNVVVVEESKTDSTSVTPSRWSNR